MAAGGGCLVIDFLKLCGTREGKREEAIAFRRTEVSELQDCFKGLSNGGERIEEQHSSWNHFTDTNHSSYQVPNDLLNSTVSYLPSQDLSETSTPHNLALARLEQLTQHLKPLFDDTDILSCGYAQCQTLLQTQRQSLPKDAQIRTCVHSGCGYVSGSAGEWRRHVGQGCGFHWEVERKGESWQQWEEEEGGRCCGA